MEKINTRIQNDVVRLKDMKTIVQGLINASALYVI